MFANQDPIRPVTIVDGSRLVADVSIDFGEALAVVQVTGDPRGAQVYSDQFAEIIQSDASVRARLEVQGGRLVVAGGSEAGGVSYDATVYESDKHGT